MHMLFEGTFESLMLPFHMLRLPVQRLYLALEARPLSGLAVHNETALMGIDYPIALIASSAH